MKKVVIDGVEYVPKEDFTNKDTCIEIDSAQGCRVTIQNHNMCDIVLIGDYNKITLKGENNYIRMSANNKVIV